MDTSLLLFQGKRTNLQMGLPNPSTAELAQFKQNLSNTHICCKGALSDPLGTRIGIEFEGPVRRCCSSWKSSQQISSEPSTANPLHTYTPPKTQKKSQSINGRGTKSQTHAFPCVAHMLVVFLVCFSALSESETARLIASSDASIVKHGQCCRSLMNSNKSKTVEWTL